MKKSIFNFIQRPCIYKSDQCIPKIVYSAKTKHFLNKTINAFNLNEDQFRVWVAMQLHIWVAFTSLFFLVAHSTCQSDMTSSSPNEGFLVANSLCETIDSQATEIQPHCYSAVHISIVLAERS